MTVPSPLYFFLWRPLAFMTVPSPLYFVLLTDFIAFIAFIAFLADFIADPDALEVPDDDKDTHVDTLEVQRENALEVPEETARS